MTVLSHELREEVFFVSPIYFQIVYAATSRPTAKRYVWRIRREGNNEILSSSEILNSHRQCLESIALVKRGASTARIDDQTQRGRL